MDTGGASVGALEGAQVARVDADGPAQPYGRQEAAGYHAPHAPLADLQPVGALRDGQEAFARAGWVGFGEAHALALFGVARANRTGGAAHAGCGERAFWRRNVGVRAPLCPETRAHLYAYTLYNV